MKVCAICGEEIVNNAKHENTCPCWAMTIDGEVKHIIPVVEKDDEPNQPYVAPKRKRKPPVVEAADEYADKVKSVTMKRPGVK